MSMDLGRLLNCSDGIHMVSTYSTNTGFCMGGALTLAAMADGAAIDAGAPFYGERSTIEGFMV